MGRVAPTSQEYQEARIAAGIPSSRAGWRMRRSQAAPAAVGWGRPGPVPLAKAALLLVGWESWIAERHTQMSNLPAEVETAPEQCRSSNSSHSQDSPAPCLLGPCLPKSPHSGQGSLLTEPERLSSRPSALRPGCSWEGQGPRDAESS